MPLIINQQPVAEDNWNYRGCDAEGHADLSDLSDAADLIVDWGYFQAARESLLARSGKLGVKINGEVDVNELAGDLAKLALVAVDFPSFADGRGFSQARLLRDSLGFGGQIRAVGDVTWDRLRFMHRCGFDAFEVAEERYNEAMLRAFDEISVRLQGASDDPRPIYRQ